MKIIEEIRNEENKKQREQIRAFDREMLSYQAYGLPPELGQYLWGFLAVLWMVFPLQTLLEGENNFVVYLGFIWSVSAPFYYLAPYHVIRENGKQVSSYQKIKYLPVDIRQVRLVRIGYIAHFLKKTLAVSMMLQVCVTLIFYHTVSFWNVLYVLLCSGAFPFLVTLCVIWLMRSHK